MPHIIVKLHPGRSEDQKSQLAEKLVESVMSIAKCERESVSIEEVNSEEWYEKVYEPDIREKQNQLVVKPGYGPLLSD